MTESTPLNENPPFYVGLCLAGAVSAGAYTAGVMDYLIEALENWEQERGKEGIPDHRVIIPVIGGASAGGMTGILTASAINNPIEHVQRVEENNILPTFLKNKFWHTWVDLTTDDIFPEMLKTDDLTRGKILSLFNSGFIDQIAARITQVDPSKPKMRPYFDNNLKVFTTLTSLKGLSFNIEFLGSGPNRDQYCITRHNDYACFELNTSVYKNDGWIPLDFHKGVSTELAANAAMATGAFPVGLQSRNVVRKSKYVNDNPWLSELTLLNPVLKQEYESLNVDGGMINNEPFEKVREILMDITGQRNQAEYNNYKQFHSTVLMIDPFPSEPPVYNNDDNLTHVIGSTLSALIGQVRIKPENLVDAVLSDKAGQFLIAPSRSVPQRNGSLKDEMGYKAIACGAFEGFSGFFNKKFRVHDYFLGRANCEKFLRDHFTVPADADNIITKGYERLTDVDKQNFFAHSGNGKQLPIIPVLTPRTDKPYLPEFKPGQNWPVLEEEDLDRYESKLQDRIYSLIMNFKKYSWLMRIFLSVGVWLVLKRTIASEALKVIKQSLYDHALLNSTKFTPSKKTESDPEAGPDLDTAVSWLMNVVRATAREKNVRISHDCMAKLHSRIAISLAVPSTLEKLESDEKKNEVYNNVRNIVLAMVEAAKPRTALDVADFNAVTTASSSSDVLS